MGWSAGRQDRLGGVLLGLAAGDALGAPYEFHTSVDAAAAEPIGGGLGPWEPGEWTDDTQMAICIAEVTATGSRDVEAIGERFLRWYADGPLDVGNQTRVVLGGAPSAGALREWAVTYLQRHPSHAAGNGSLMRTAPLALACLGDDAALADLARAVSELTHADPLAGDACVLWCVAIDRAVREDRLDGVRDGLDLLAPDAREPWRDRLDEAEARPPEAFTPNGFVVTALQAAHAAIRQTPVPGERPGAHLELALRRAVGIGHDTDTVAAIAGALLGARWGWSAIPQRWLRILHGWPGLRARDLLTLALRTASGGHDDAAGWPGATSLHAHYRASDPTPPRVVAAPRDDGLLLGNATGLAEAASEVDAVVSLCRSGSAEVAEGVEHLHVPLVDEPGANPNLRLLLDDLAATISALREEGKRVFLHCAGSRSRTPTVAAWHLARRDGVPARTALDEVADALPEVWPNAEFVALLTEAIDDLPNPPAEALDWDRVLAWQAAIGPDRLAAIERAAGDGDDAWGTRAWSEVAGDLLRDLSEVGVIAPFDWPTWLQRRGEALLGAEAALADASLEDCRRLLAALARSARFTDGAWEAALERGTVQAILGRVATLRGDAAPSRG